MVGIVYNNVLKKLFFGCIVVLICNTLVAQRCEWLGVGGAANNNEINYDVAIDQNNDVITVGLFSDSFSVGVQHFPKSTNAFQSSYIVKYNSAGAVKWVKTIQHSGMQGCFASAVKTDINNNIYVAGTFVGSLDFGNNITLNQTNNTQAYFLVKYNSTGIAQWAVKSGGTGVKNASKIAIDAAGNVYLSATFTNTLSFAGTTKVLTDNGNRDVAIVKYSSTGGFINAVGFGSSAQEIAIDVGIDGSNNIILLGVSNGTLNFGAQQLPNKGEMILKLDSALNPIKGKKTDLKTGNNTSTNGIAVQPNGKFVVTNNFFDSVNFGNNIWLKSPWSSQGLIASKTPSLGIIYYDTALNPIWARTNDSLSSTQPSISPIGGVSMQNDNIYFGGTLLYTNTRFGAATLNFVGGQQKFFVTKMDTLGNFLWSFISEDTNSKSFLFATEPDINGNVYICGYFNNKVTVFNQSKNAIAPGNTVDFYIAKISDYTITRGPVSSGPYCAGDTLKIPYTKQGVYKVGNEFIAELSDSAGNFDGGHRELGRVKDTADGIINGKLPLLNVPTTNKYRIRILSTDPVVQSYYRIDTLRLLIYSRDSANAGEDFYVCKGEPVRLGTTGGSKWLWTPTNYFINPADSTNRQPEIKLYDSVEFRIIISDSSGCGDVDTDYVKVYVRPHIETQIQGDSIICRGFRQNLKAQTTGGDSSQYWYQWKVVGLNLIQGTGSTLFVRPAATTQYQVVVGDSCSDKTDTAYFTVNVFTNLQAHPSPDTTICKGKTAQLSVQGTGCNPNKYTYEWTEKGSSTVLSTNDSLTVTPGTTTQYQIILKDTSTLLIDTATITVSIDSIFNITTIPDSTICIGQTIDLTTNIFSCDTSNMQYTWTANNQQLSTNNQITVNPSQTTTYTLIGENTFNGLKDTTQVTITVRPKLELTINPDTTICIGEHAELRATATGGRTSTRSIIWSEAGSQWTVATPNTKVSPTVTTTYKAILSDGCTVNNDSATITVNVRPKLELTVNPDTTICIGGQAELRATANGGLATAHKIQWENNGQSLSNNPKLTLSPTQTSTYTAILSDNCTTPNDSAEITITVRPKLELTVNPDSTICIGEQAELRAIPQGGYTPQHQIQWIANNQQLSTNNIIQVTPTQTTTYQARLTDNCTTPNDSAELTITVRPPLQLTTAAKDSICSNEILLLTATPTGGYTPNHQIQWTTTNSTWTSNQNPATDTPQHTTTYIATLTDNCSPPVQDTLQVIVLPIPIADFTVNPTAGCPPLKITLQDNSQNNDSTQNTWTIGNTEYQSTQTQTHELLKQGTYSIKLNVKNRLGCSDEKTQQNIITVFEKPQADFIIKPDIKEVEEPLELYNQSQNEVRVIWDMGDGKILSPEGNGDTTYIYNENDTGLIKAKIIAINNQGCRDTAQKLIRLFDKVNCTIPTAFTPNGDGLNNTFKPVCVGAATYTLTIYNRWGQVIYQQKNGAWDGNYIEQPVPMGVYMYKIQINAQSQKKKLTYGTVQLIR